MTSPLYQTTPVLLPGAVTTDFDGGVESSAQAAQILIGSGDPTGVVVSSPGSFYTDRDTDTVYSNTTGDKADWAVLNAGSTSPLTTKGDLFGHSTVDARVPSGTQGQVLSVNTGAAVGLTWIDYSPLVSKGDLYTFAGGIEARLPVGGDTQMLVADHTQTTGLKWTAAPDLSLYLLISDAVAEFAPIVQNPILATVADGDTFNFNTGRPYLLHLAADAATFTININKPPNGSIVRFAFDHAIAAVTWNSVGVANGYVGAPAAIATGDAFAWIYDSSGDKYWPYKG